MDALVRAALAGTARGGEAPAPDTPAGALVAQLPELTPERRLLLLAGAGAIYRQSGRRPATVAAPDPAPAERLLACSPAAARLIREVAAGQHVDLLPEALGRLRRSGLRLSPGLVPAALALGARDAALRPALLATMGERGPWLAAQNPAWCWAAERLPTAGEPPSADAETIWQEGTAAQRLALLRVVRAHDPARGRDWLVAVWAQEKAEFRAEAITALQIGLSGDDEAFLEAALDDRSKVVRAAASRLLARLPGSALAARMRERADALLDYAPPAAPGGLRRLARAIAGGGPAAGTLRATPPDACDPAWQRDGVEPKPPAGIGERAWWLTQVLALVPVMHWSERFATTPEALIAAAAGDEWGPVVIEGWSRAIELAPDAGWAAALCVWWSGRDTAGRSHELVAPLLASLPQAEAERLVEQHLVQRGADPQVQTTESGERIARDTLDARWIQMLNALPSPWSARFGTIYLGAIRAHLRKSSSASSLSPGAWLSTLLPAARALPSDCFAAALEEWPLPETSDWLWQRWRNEIEQFSVTIRLRQRLMKEIPL